MLTVHLKRDKYGREEEVHKYLYPNVQYPYTALLRILGETISFY